MTASTATPATAAREPIAIIGMACMYPGAADLKSFWRNIIDGVDAIGDPGDDWDAQRYLDSGRIQTARGGYLKALYRFDPREFGIMPNSLDGGEPDQFLALKVAADALRDAGWLRPDADHRDTGIVLGHSTYLHRGQGSMIQNHIVVDQTLELLKTTSPHLDDAALAQVRQLLLSKLPNTNPEVAPGLVPNVMTGRIANRLNLKGPNYLVDAACSSSLLAVNAAIDELRLGRSRMMIAGGVNASLPAEVAVIFTQLGALSRRGKVRPFSVGSDGTLLGEGLGMVVLKRLSDARADGDRIYALLRGVGQASDGRGTGLLAPSVEGEALAIARAYADCGVDPASISLIEAHGTGIPLGDKTEIAALKTVFGERRSAQPSIALGSVKSMVSHTIPAAGLAGLIKTALALHHKVLPPMLCDEINPELGIEHTPLFVNSRTAPWLVPPGQPRRAGVNSFGFGGINTHAIVEEAPADSPSPERLLPWPAELCLASADSPEALAERLAQVDALISARPDLRLADVAASMAQADRAASCRLAVVATDLAGLQKQLRQAGRKLAEPKKQARWSTRTGLSFAREPLAGQLAFVFPGEGSQYPAMLADLALCFDEVRQWLDFWCGLYDDAPGERRTDIAYPPATGLDEAQRQALEARMNDMDVGSEAVFVGGLALHQLLLGFGVLPDAMLGHSSGESSALAASGAMNAGSPQQLAAFIRELNGLYREELASGRIPTGALMAVGALDRASIEAQMAAVDPALVVAMDNCPNQTIVYGSVAQVDALRQRLIQAGAVCMPLPFDRGYHTPAFDSMSKAFLKYYRSVKLGAPKLPLYSCASAGLFPDQATGTRQLAAAQWSDTVRFRETVLKMHDDGVRSFIEVGPSSNLSAFVQETLAGREFLSLATNQRRKGGVEQFLSVLGQLWVHQRPVDLARLWQGRGLTPVALDDGRLPAARGVLLSNTMPRIVLTEAERAQLGAWTAPPAAAGVAAPAASAASAASAEAAAPTAATPAVEPPPAPVPAPAPTPVPSLPAPVAAATPLPAPAPEPQADDGRAALMGSYFDLMRDFLAQQQGVMDRLSQQPEAFDVVDHGADAATDPLSARTPFLAQIDWAEDGQSLRAEVPLDTRSDAFLRDHVLSGPVSEADPRLHGLACVPLMVSLEIMAQGCAVLAGRVDLALIERVRAFDWIALDEGQLTLTLEVRWQDAAAQRCAALLSGPQGRLVSAEFSFAPDWRLPALPALPEWRPARWNDGELYSTGMFHGPVFHSVAHIDGWSDAGIDAQLFPMALDGFFSPGQPTALITQPVLLDATGQLAAYWVAQGVGTDYNCFPSTIERIELYPPRADALPGGRLLARQQPLDGNPSADMSVPRAWDFEALDAQGQPVLRVSRLVNVFYPVPNRFYRTRHQPVAGWLGEPTGLGTEAKGVLSWQLAHLDEDFCAQSSQIFLRILAQALLSPTERAQWSALQGTVRHKRQWLLGRACLKEAVRQWVAQHTGHALYSADIEVHHDALGAPWVDGWWCDQLLPRPQVSLSHDAHGAVAAVAAPDQPVGIDRERQGRIRDLQAFTLSLAEVERQELASVPAERLAQHLLAVWCAKEAAAKCLGTGLQGQPDAFVVRWTDVATGSAQVQCPEGQTLAVQLYRQGDALVALAALAL